MDGNRYTFIISFGVPSVEVETAPFDISAGDAAVMHIGAIRPEFLAGEDQIVEVWVEDRCSNELDSLSYTLLITLLQNGQRVDSAPDPQQLPDADSSSSAFLDLAPLALAVANNTGAARRRVPFTVGLAGGNYRAVAAAAMPTSRGTLQLSATSTAFAVLVGAASALQVTAAPTFAVAQEVVQPSFVIAAKDRGGNTVTDSAFAVRARKRSGQRLTSLLLGETETEAVGGVAVFDALVISIPDAAFVLEFALIAVGGGGGVENGNGSSPPAVAPPVAVTEAARVLRVGAGADVAEGGVAFGPQPRLVVQDAALGRCVCEGGDGGGAGRGGAQGGRATYANLSMSMRRYTEITVAAPLAAPSPASSSSFSAPSSPS